MVNNDILKMEGKEPNGGPARRRSWLGKAGVNSWIDALAGPAPGSRILRRRSKVLGG